MNFMNPQLAEPTSVGCDALWATPLQRRALGRLGASPVAKEGAIWT